eukprot:gene9441-9521_t
MPRLAQSTKRPFEQADEAVTVQSAIAFAGAFFVLVLVPGPAIATIISRTLSSGKLTGFALTTGFILGDFIFLGVAAFGLSHLATTLGPMFQVVKYIGAAYLAYLGYKCFISPARGLDVRAVKAASPLKEIASGLLLTLGNPKPILFYSALLPTFFDVTHLQKSDFWALGGIIIGVSYLVNGSYIVLADRARHVFRSSSAVKKLNQATGTVLLGSSLAIATR